MTTDGLSEVIRELVTKYLNQNPGVEIKIVVKSEEKSICESNGLGSPLTVRNVTDLTLKLTTKQRTDVHK